MRTQQQTNGTYTRPAHWMRAMDPHDGGGAGEGVLLPSEDVRKPLSWSNAMSVLARRYPAVAAIIESALGLQ